MTALGKYQRLECPGLWRAAPEAQRRDVGVSFGDASLVLSDDRSGLPLAHWSLPAVRRRNPGESPAIFSPDNDVGETVEIEDVDMIDALDTVQRSLRRGRGQRGILRLVILGSFVVGAVLLATFWLPGALQRHAVNVLPAAKSAEIGQMILADLEAAGHPVCNGVSGRAALALLGDRLAGAGAEQLVVLGGADAPDVLALPGGIVALGQPMMERHDTAEIAAGHVLAAGLIAETAAPLSDALRRAGVRATFGLLTTGDLPAGALNGHGVALRDAEMARPDDAALLARFEAVGVPARPYAQSLTPGDERAQALIARDPYRDRAPPAPVLSDDAWVSLQGICAN